MAAAFPDIPLPVHIPAPQPVDPVEAHINRFFDRVVVCANQRRLTLLAAAHEKREEMLARVTRREHSEHQLLAVRANIERDLRENLLQETQERLLAEIEHKLAEVRVPHPETRLVLRGEFEQLEQLLLCVGEILEEEVPVVPRYLEMRPIVAVGKQGQHPGELWYPNGVAIDEATNQIYVAEGCIYPKFARVLIFSETGEYLNSYAHEHMEALHGIAIHRNNVYVTDCCLHAVFHFKIEVDFRLVDRLGSEGSGIGQFKEPRQLTVSTNGDVYIADRDNDRIQILDSSLHPIRVITHPSMHRPHDVKLTTEEMYVLSEKDSMPTRVHSRHTQDTLPDHTWCGNAVRTASAAADGEQGGRFSNLSVEERGVLVSQGKEILTRHRQKQKTEKLDLSDEVEKRLGEVRESHKREIELIRANAEEEKSRELSLLSEELTKQYKYHIEQLEAKLQVTATDRDDDVITRDLEAYKSKVEQQASKKVEAYYQQYTADVQQLQDETDALIDGRNQLVEENTNLRTQLGQERKLRGTEWETEKLVLLQRLQEADTQVSGLESLLGTERGEVDRLVAERDETRGILDNREKEKIALSRHFTNQIQKLEQEKVQLSQQVDRHAESKHQLETEKHELVNQLNAARRGKENLEYNLNSLENNINELSGELEIIKSENVQLQELLLQKNSMLAELGKNDEAITSLRGEIEYKIGELKVVNQRFSEAERENSELSQRLGEANLGINEANSVISSLRVEIENKNGELIEVGQEVERLKKEIENEKMNSRNIISQREEAKLNLTRAQEQIIQLQTELDSDEIETKNFSQFIPAMKSQDEQIMKLSNEISAVKTYKRSMEEEKIFVEKMIKEQDKIIERAVALKISEKRDLDSIIKRKA